MKGDTLGLVLCGEMTGAQTLRVFWMRADDNARGRVVKLRLHQHFAEDMRRKRAMQPAMAKRGVAPHLVYHQHIAGRRRRYFRVGAGIFAKVVRAQPCHAKPRGLQQGVVVQRVGGQKRFQIAGPGGVVIDALLVKQQAKGRLPPAAGKQRAQESIFHAQDGGTCMAGQGFGAGGAGARGPMPRSGRMFWANQCE